MARCAGAVCLTIVSATVATPTATASTSTVGDADRSARKPPSVTDRIPTRRVIDWVRHSMTKVIRPTTAMKPSMFRVPKMPWIGPPVARSPEMPSAENGVSSSTPDMISSASEMTSSHRSVSPIARTVWSVSRT